MTTYDLTEIRRPGSIDTPSMPVDRGRRSVPRRRTTDAPATGPV